MSSSPILIPEAKVDVTDAYLWYEEQSLGLGMEFLRCIEAALLSIQRTPMIYPVVHEAYRRALVRRFPFAIFFGFDDVNNGCVFTPCSTALRIQTSGAGDCPSRMSTEQDEFRILSLARQMLIHDVGCKRR